MRTWNGTEPDKCNLCGRDIIEVFIDGFARTLGSWAMMCRSCHRLHGTGLGTGKGQRFRLLHGVWIDERDMPSAPINREQLLSLLKLNRNYNHIPRDGGFAEPQTD